MIADDESLITLIRGQGIWVTAGTAAVDHAVTFDVMAATLADETGEYVSLCGTRFLPAAAHAAPCPPCSVCVGFLRARRTVRDHAARRRRAPASLFARLFGGSS